MRRSEDERLDALFQAFRDCPTPEPGANFMPNLWAKIKSRQSFTFSFRRMTGAFVTAALALSIALGVYLAIPRPTSPTTLRPTSRRLPRRTAWTRPISLARCFWIIPIRAGDPTMLKTKSSAVLSLVLVFVSGGLVGALAHRAYIVNAASANPANQRKPGPEDWRKRVLPEMRAKLKLDDQQFKQLNALLDQVDVDMRELRTKQFSQTQAIQNALVEKINAMLRADQLELYKAYRAERDKERERRRMQGTLREGRAAQGDRADRRRGRLPIASRAGFRVVPDARG